MHTAVQQTPGWYMHFSTLRILFALICFNFLQPAFAINDAGRLGIGLSQAFITGNPAISLKLNKSRSFAIGALLQLRLDDNTGSTGAGLKIYRTIFIEPQLNFYSSVMGAYLKQKTATTNQSGWQIDLSLGSEFSFKGLESIGFSFEAGVTMHKLTDDFIVETLGNHIVQGAVHFYI